MVPGRGREDRWTERCSPNANQRRGPPPPPSPLLLVKAYLKPTGAEGQNAKGGREERIEEGEKQQGQEGPWDPSPELPSVEPKQSQ